MPIYSPNCTLGIVWGWIISGPAFMLESMPLKSLTLMALRYLEGKNAFCHKFIQHVWSVFCLPCQSGQRAGWLFWSIDSCWLCLAQASRIYQNSTQKFWFMNAASKNKWWLFCVQDPSLCKQLAKHAKHIWFIYSIWTCTARVSRAGGGTYSTCNTVVAKTFLWCAF